MASISQALRGVPGERISSDSRESQKYSQNQPDSITSVYSGNCSLADCDSRTLAGQAVSMAGADTVVPGVRGTPSQNSEKKSSRLSPDGYFPEAQIKNLIVLHFTAGTTCDSAFRTWEADQKRIATAYGVDPDGSIVEFFPPEAWAYHLGVKGTHQHDRRSIGIEIANPGPLKKDSGNPRQLNWWPNEWGTRYCDVAEQHRYVTAPYRGMDHFALMPTIQQEAVGRLVKILCEQFSIPRHASHAARNGDFDPAAFANYQGVASHSNFRRDKWDVGPAFHWDYLGF